jgi:hypothetical protein
MPEAFDDEPLGIVALDKLAVDLPRLGALARLGATA